MFKRIFAITPTEIFIILSNSSLDRLNHFIKDNIYAAIILSIIDLAVAGSVLLHLGILTRCDWLIEIEAVERLLRKV